MSAALKERMAFADSHIDLRRLPAVMKQLLVKFKRQDAARQAELLQQLLPADGESGCVS